MTLQRNNTIDIIKGFLIVCVILGHVLLGSIDDNIFRYIIYSFHMPLFMFMSGYMISVSKISQMTFPDIFSKYWKRMLKMWLVAFLIFSAYQVLKEPTIKQIAVLIYSPWYHLWYIPTLFSFILISRFLFVNVNKYWSYLILIMIPIIWYVLSEILPITLPRWFDFKYLPYFSLGLFFKNHYKKITRRYPIIPILYIITILALKYFNVKIDELLQIILLIPVITLYLYPAIKQDMLGKPRFLAFVGQNSLDIYLWHMIPIILLKDFISNTSLYYVLSTVLICSFIAFAMIKSGVFSKK